MIGQIRDHLRQIALQSSITKTAYARNPKTLPESGLPCAVVMGVGSGPITRIGEPLIQINRVFQVSWFCHKITLESLPEDEELVEDLLDETFEFYLSRGTLGIGLLPAVPFVQNVTLNDAGSLQKLAFAKESYFGFTLSFIVQYYSRVVRKANQ